ncbi:MAG: hypothetical protein AB1721_00925 [Patescibacteria group bacterium]
MKLKIFNRASKQIPEAGNFSKPRKKFSYKKAVIWLTVFLFVSGGIFVWYRFFSPEGREQLKYDLFQKYYIEPYEKAMREDVYGGKTPEETLNLFIDALKKGDIELASKYFALNTNENSEYYLEYDPKWKRGLELTKEANKLDEVIEKLSFVKPDKERITSEEDFKFILEKNGEILGYINLELNPYSGVWKIESM